MPRGSYPRNISAEERFWSFVTKTDGDECWPWRLSVTGGGYGLIQVKEKQYYVHRFVLALYGRKIPPGMVVDHICRNRRCVNPKHLRIVTARVNTTENSTSPAAKNLSKSHCLRGHELSPENLIKKIRPGRECILCQRIRQKTNPPNDYYTKKKD